MLLMTVSSQTTFPLPLSHLSNITFLSCLIHRVPPNYTVCTRLTFNLSLLPHYSLRYVSSLVPGHSLRTHILITSPTDWTPTGITSFIMNAGSATKVTDFDGWMVRDWWRHLASRYNL